MKFNKKASLFMQWGVWIINMIVLVALVLFVTGVVKGTIEKQVEIDNLQAQLIAKRIIYSPNCFAYENPDLDSKVILGAIDMFKANEENLKNCLDKNSENFGVKVSISNMPDIYLNKQVYEDFKPISFGLNYQNYEDIFFVRVVENGESKFNFIKIDVVGIK